MLSNAGIVRLSDGPDDYAQIWQDVLSTNLSGGFHGVTAAIPHLISGGRGGSIVFTGSTAGVRPTANPNTAALAHTVQVGRSGEVDHRRFPAGERGILHSLNPPPDGGQYRPPSTRISDAVV